LEAEKDLRRCTALRLQQTRDFPNSPHFVVQLASGLARLANLAADRGDLSEARRLQEQVLTYRRAALALVPANSGYRAAISTACTALIVTLIRMREHEAAAKVVAEFAALSPESGPACTRAGWLLARCIPLATVDPRLPTSRRDEVARGYADRAVELLRQAKRSGYRDDAVLKTDPTFEPLRSRADFQEILAGAAAPHAGQGP
jgi:hypothetical protein